MFSRLGMVVLIGVAICLRAVPTEGASFATAPDVDWADPGTVVLQSTGTVAGTVSQWRQQCTRLTYRMTGDLTHTMQQGCFVPAAYGLFDESSSIAILNGTDEGIPVRYFDAAIPLAVLPNSSSAVLFDGYPMYGRYMRVYTNFAGVMNTVTSLHPYKNVTAAANITVSYGNNQPLPVNPMAFASSAGGQWVFTESPDRALVRVSMSDYSVLPFGQPSLSPAAANPATMAITEDGRYAARSHGDSLMVYDLATCGDSGSSDPLAPHPCQSHDFWAALTAKIPHLSYLSQLDFVQDGLLSFNAHTADGTVTSYILSPDGAINSLTPYLALGDSYASGQGAFDYLAGTDTATDKCHLSARSYPLLLSGDVFGAQGHSVACSGARITDLANSTDGYAGQASDGSNAAQRKTDGSASAILHDFLPGYLAQWQFVQTYQPGTVTIQVGGNDAGFAAILERCINPFTSQGHCYSSYEDRLELEQTIDRIYPRWVALFSQLHTLSPASRLYAVGYPQILSSQGRCGLNTPLTAADITFARNLTDYLNAAMRQAAQTAGARYIDISNALEGFELCSGNDAEPAMNGLTAGTDALGILGQESFHPTAFGHQLIEQAILTATHNFATGTDPSGDDGQDAPFANDSDALLQGVPRTDRQLNTVTYLDDMPPGLVRTGTATHLFVGDTDTSYSLVPWTNYTVTLDGSRVLATPQSGIRSGSISTDITIPADTSDGIHTIAVSGVDQNGQQIQLIQVVDTYQNPDDHDGDGQGNDRDSCPYVPNSGVDKDADGIDDVCDTTISATADNLPPNNNADGIDQGLNTDPGAADDTAVQAADITLQPAVATTMLPQASGTLAVTAPSGTNTSAVSATARTPQVLGASDTIASASPAALKDDRAASAMVRPGIVGVVQWYDWPLLLLVMVLTGILIRRWGGREKDRRTAAS